MRVSRVREVFLSVRMYLYMCCYMLLWVSACECVNICRRYLRVSVYLCVLARVCDLVCLYTNGWINPCKICERNKLKRWITYCHWKSGTFSPMIRVRTQSKVKISTAKRSSPPKCPCSSNIFTIGRYLLFLCVIFRRGQRK